MLKMQKVAAEMEQEEEVVVAELMRSMMPVG